MDQTCDRSRVLALVGLQPTLVDIGASPNGVQVYAKLKYFQTVIGLIGGTLSCLPLELLEWMMRLHMGSLPTRRCIIEAMRLLDCRVLTNTMHMALHEMDEITSFKHLHHAAASALSEKLLLLYVHPERLAMSAVCAR